MTDAEAYERAFEEWLHEPELEEIWGEMQVDETETGVLPGV